MAAAHVLLACLTYIPLLLTKPGRVGADTKTYLYLDPGELLRRAPFMWDPNVGMGTLTHQTIGYLFPMGPWYWVMDQLGLPDWVAQRLWLATVLFAAAAGVLFLCRTLGWPEGASGPRGDRPGAAPRQPAGALASLAGPVAAALVYMCSPYVLDYAARISVILLPWAALPWLVGLAVRALRTRSWRHPALFSLVVLLVGGVNATALLFAGLGPVLWFPFAVFVHREATGRQAIATMARIGAITAAVSLWWVAGLLVQGRYGIPILRYTETVEAVSRTSVSTEVLRGLGYWFFYGSDKIGPWIEPAVLYTQQIWLMAVSFTIPILALVAAAIVRWGYRAYFGTLIIVGTVIAVGAHPYEEPSALGGLFKAFATTSTAGLALRSTARAVPLVMLGMAMLVAAAVAALARRRPGAGLLAGALVGIVALAGLPPLFTGQVGMAENLDRAEEIPEYWRAAAAALDERDDGTRVLALPGIDFAAYRWGNTVDPILPYLMDRPFVGRELIPYGSPASADLLNALDRRLQEGVFEPSALGPLARLMAVGDVMVRSDLQFERYRTARPRSLWNQLNPPPAGLGAPVAFGPPAPNVPVPKLPLIDEVELGLPPGAAHPPPVAAFPVTGASAPTGIVRTATAERPVVIAGDGEGVVELAAAGLLTGNSPLLYAASLDATNGWSAALDQGADLVLTDSNRLRARRWGTVRENAGYTEPPGAGPLRFDPADNRLDLFPEADNDAFTTAEQRGVTAVRATRYGNPVSFTAEDRPANALDGDVTTAWRVGAFADVTGEKLRVDLAAPVTASSVRLVQPVTGPRNRYITTARLHFDQGPPVDVVLGPESRTPAGQVVAFDSRQVGRLEVEVGDTNFGLLAKYDGVSGVGLAEVGIEEARVDEVVRLPANLLRAAGPRAQSSRLTVVVARQRSNPSEPVRTDEEPTMRRVFALPAGRSFSVSGTARLAASAADEVLDRIIGVPGAGEGGVTARAEDRLAGNVRARAAAAIDGDATTAWTPGFTFQAGRWLEVEAAAPVTFGHLDLQVMTDGRHSVPTRLRIDVDGAPARTIDLPAAADRAEEGSTVTWPLDFDPVTGRTIRFTFEQVRSVLTLDYYSEEPVELPVAIVELGVPGLRSSPAASTFSTPCRPDLLTVDGRPFAVRVSGEVRAALDREGLSVEACGPPLDLGPGDHEIRTAPGRSAGIELDRLVLDSPAQGSVGAAAARPASSLPATAGVTASTRTSFDVRVDVTEARPFWLVLAQSHNRGWTATVGGRDLGPPHLVDGYANGWLIDPEQAGALDVRLRWTPQRLVWIALAVSALAILGALGIVLATSRRSAARRSTAGRLEVPELDLRGVAERDGARSSRPSAVDLAWAVAIAVFFGAAAAPMVGALAGLAALLGSTWPPARRLLRFGAAGALGLGVAYMLFQQARYRYPPDFAWPQNFPRAHLLGWLAVALLAADLVQPARRRASRHPRAQSANDDGG